jgi:hypothetical protein
MGKKPKKHKEVSQLTIKKILCQMPYSRTMIGKREHQANGNTRVEMQPNMGGYQGERKRERGIPGKERKRDIGEREKGKGKEAKR